MISTAYSNQKRLESLYPFLQNEANYDKRTVGRNRLCYPRGIILYIKYSSIIRNSFAHSLYTVDVLGSWHKRNIMVQSLYMS